MTWEVGTMGIVLILLGLVSAGMVADFLVENHLGAAPSQSFELLGSSFGLSREELVFVSFIAGVAFVLLLAVGIRLVRHRRLRRRVLKRRLGDLDRENGALRSRALALDTTVRVHAAEANPRSEHALHTDDKNRMTEGVLR
jgi:hypothetical protein